jgi:hypothetical protein
MTDEVEERTDHTIGAARAGLGLLVTVPFVPPSLKHGMPLRRKASNEEAKAWVADAEERFQKAADMERRGHSWIPHVATLAVSGGAAFYLLQVEDHPKEAAITLAGGIVVGELKVWTQPKVAWRAYDAEAAARPRRGGQAPVGAAGSRWGRPVLVPSAWATREGALFGVGGIF